MRSSLPTFHSFTGGSPPHPPVSVYGTDDRQLPHQLFLPADSTELGRAEALPCHHLSALRPTGLDGQSTRPLLRRFGVPDGFDTVRRGRNVNRLSIGYAFGASP